MSGFRAMGSREAAEGICGRNLHRAIYQLCFHFPGKGALCNPTAPEFVLLSTSPWPKRWPIPPGLTKKCSAQ